jgi:hypothetical protein
MVSLIEHEWHVQLIATSSDVHCDITDTAAWAISLVCCKRIADFLLRAMNGLAVARRASSHVQMHPSSSGSLCQAQQPDKHTNSDHLPDHPVQLIAKQKPGIARFCLEDVRKVQTISLLIL